MTDDVSQTATERSGDEGLQEFRALVRAAFEQARNSGKPDWVEMTSAVLKNRLLSLTDRQFSQDRYGSPSFIHLVRRVPDLLEVLDEAPPFRLRLRDESATEQPVEVVPFGDQAEDRSEDAAWAPPRDWRQVRVREDLWRAIVDCYSATAYILDPETRVARAKKPTEPTQPELPTLKSAEVASWRQEFASELAPSARTENEDRLREWTASGGQPADLPHAIRGRWAEFEKKKVVRRLLGWFEGEGLSAPSDMLVKAQTRRLPQSEAIEDVVRTRQLRDLVIRAVRNMTYEELAKLPIPAEVILRAVGRTVSDHDA